MYRPASSIPVLGATPVISTLSALSLARGNTYSVTALRMNGLSEAVAYGDDAQPATNYPIVRLTMADTSHVFYCRTFDHSTRAIGPSAIGSTSFTVPAGAETGRAIIELVANGIPSRAVGITVL
jgi:hypothetical protein